MEEDANFIQQRRELRMSFFDEEGDKRMESQNFRAWQAITQAVMDAKSDLPKRNWNVLDWGCHSGGLLEHIHDELGARAKKLDGVEPDDQARAKAATLMAKRLDADSLFYSDLTSVPSNSVDVFVAHEVLYLVELDWFFRQLERVLHPGGAAFVALGSHKENSAWMRWREVLLEKHGHTSVVHEPWRIVRKANEGFKVGYRELWPAGYPETNWYSPPADGWGEFLSMEEALAFRRAKLLFQFWPR